MFSSLLARFSPTHTWDESSNDDKRTCQVCGRVEHYEDTDGWVAPSWRLLRAATSEHTLQLLSPQRLTFSRPLS
jgi:hypothetical protein